MNRLAVVALVLALAALGMVVSWMREDFSLGAIFGKVVTFGKNVGQGAARLGQQAWAMTKAPSTEPTYVGRRWDGADWSCPDGTVDTGKDDAHACLTSQFTHPVWRWDGKQWAWSCSNGTVPTGQSDWNKQCEVGYQGRVLMNGKWQCPPGSTDTGATWENSDWASAHKTCRRTTAYTQRLWDGVRWSCPPGTKDTGKQWSTSPNHCKYLGG